MTHPETLPADPNHPDRRSAFAELDDTLDQLAAAVDRHTETPAPLLDAIADAHYTHADPRNMRVTPRPDGTVAVEVGHLHLHLVGDWWNIADLGDRIGEAARQADRRRHATLHPSLPGDFQ